MRGLSIKDHTCQVPTKLVQFGQENTHGILPRRFISDLRHNARAIFIAVKERCEEAVLKRGEDLQKDGGNYLSTSGKPPHFLTGTVLFSPEFEDNSKFESS